MTPTYRAKLRRAQERLQADSRRITRTHQDPNGLTWEGRVIEREIDAELFPVILLRVTGPMELHWSERMQAHFRCDLGQFNDVFPLIAERPAWTHPVVNRNRDRPNIGQRHVHLFRAAKALAAQVLAEEPRTFQLDQLRLLEVAA